MARRNTTPLFEIVSRNGNGQAAPTERGGGAGGPSSVEPKPAGQPAGQSEVIPALASRRERPAPVERITPADIEAVEAAEVARPAAGLTGAREAEARELPRTMGRMSVSGGLVRLPVNYGYIGLSVVFVCVLMAWTLGYVFGGSNAQERARREIESATGGGLVDPLAGDEGTSGRVAETPGRGSEPRVTPVEPRPGVGTSGSGVAANAVNLPSGAGMPAVVSQRTRYLTAGGFFASEPRTEGLNYFCLVSRLPEADTVGALEFLGRNGVKAVGVERASSDANNRSFELYTLEGLSRDEYAGESGTDRRATHEALVAELGRRWRAEERGTSDFSRPQWYRYNP